MAIMVMDEVLFLDLNPRTLLSSNLEMETEERDGPLARSYSREAYE